MTPARADLRDLGERLDRHRKDRIEQHGHLTVTALYNVLERVRALDAGADVAPLSESERDVYDAGLVGVLGEIHDEIDKAVLRAYGWDDLIDPLVGKPGATCPTPHKSADQEAAEQTLLSRLVALNEQRRAEEQQGTVHWLRPDYQLPKLRHKLPHSTQIEAPEMEPVAADSQPSWPKDDLEQIRVVHQLLETADAPATPESLARSFAGRTTPKRKQRVGQVLQTLAATGAARTPPDDPDRFFVPR